MNYCPAAGYLTIETRNRRKEFSLALSENNSIYHLHQHFVTFG